MADSNQQPASPDVAITLDSFERCAIPLEAWNHRAHLTVAYLYLRALSLEDATDRMRRGVQKFNASNGIEQTPTGGYHETLTIAWMNVLHATMAAYGPGSSADDFLSQHPHLLSKVLLRLYYSRPRIMSDQARHGWVEPDLSPLPKPPPPPAAPVPTIRTARLVLRHWRLDDVEALARICSDKAIAEMTATIPHPYTREHAEQFIRMRVDGPADGKPDGVTVFAVDAPRHGLVAAVGLHGPAAGHMAELGYWVAREHWGNGYATEISEAAVRFGFEVRGLQRIYAGYYKRNPASGRVLEKLGFKPEGCLRAHVQRFGVVNDLMQMGLLRDEWESGKGSHSQVANP